jgi:protein-disulfide isomerase-like protein with CxxC motif
MVVRAHYFTDPASSASWAAEPARRGLIVEFGATISFTYVMGGLAREYGPDRGPLVEEWLNAADRSGMPLDPRLWMDSPIASTYPACMAVKAAAEQGKEDRYLRALREGLMCFRRKLDTTEALVEEARRAGLDVERFRIDLGSHAIVEAFGADLERTRAVPDEARERGATVAAPGGERLVFPTVCFTADDGALHWVFGEEDYGAWREAALAAGAQPSGEPPSVLDALDRLGRMATAEVEAVCDLPGPRAPAELWRLAAEWRVKPLPVLTGHLWEAT